MKDFDVCAFYVDYRISDPDISIQGLRQATLVASTPNLRTRILGKEGEKHISKNGHPIDNSESQSNWDSYLNISMKAKERFGMRLRDAFWRLIEVSSCL